MLHATSRLVELAGMQDRSTFAMLPYDTFEKHTELHDCTLIPLLSSYFCSQFHIQLKVICSNVPLFIHLRSYVCLMYHLCVLCHS